jgi:hypothetical protein
MGVILVHGPLFNSRRRLVELDQKVESLAIDPVVEWVKQLLLCSYFKTQWVTTKCNWNPVYALKTAIINVRGRKYRSLPRSSAWLADFLLAYSVVKNRSWPNEMHVIQSVVSQFLPEIKGLQPVSEPVGEVYWKYPTFFEQMRFVSYLKHW